MLRGSLDAMGVGRKMDTCVCVAESLQDSPEIIRILLISYACMHACLVTQSCPTLCDPMGRNLPGSSGHGILQARILEWVAMPFSLFKYMLG